LLLLGILDVRLVDIGVAQKANRWRLIRNQNSEIEVAKT
jgi:hypothetical protein